MSVAPNSSETPKGSGATGEAPPAKKTRRLGDYELLGKLGQGAMGTVYLARQMSADRKVALKILPKDLAQDEEFLERFRREARNATRIVHPNVVSAYEIGVIENFHFIAMEYVDGPNLEIVLQKKGIFTEEQLLRVTSDMALALQAAEAQGIVHRDIKPANILMNSQGVSKLADMGLASAAKGDQRVTLAGFAVGTPFYISPEQARGVRDVDVRSDIYSLGVTLYQLSTGALPFSGNNPVLIMTQHVSEIPAPPHKHKPSMTPQFSALIQKMMEKDTAKRQQTAKELAEDVARVQRGEMPSAAKAGGRPLAAAPAPAPSETPEPTGPKLSFVDWLLAERWRLPVIASSGTLFLLALMYFIVKFLKH